MISFLDFLRKVLNPQQICVVCLLATMGLGGYALKTFASNKDVKEIKAELLRKSLLDLRIEQCKTIKAGNSATFYAQRIQEQAAKYREITGSPPDLPLCSEI